MKISAEDLAILCRTHGPNLKVESIGLDGARVLWAFAGKESSFGKRCIPYHEKAYCYGGRYYGSNAELRAMTEEFGCAAHASYGPWQILFWNARQHNRQIDPMRLMIDMGTCAGITVAEFNRIIEKQKPQGILDLADAWNSGNCHDDNHPTEYMNSVQGFYTTAIMPA